MTATASPRPALPTFHWHARVYYEDTDASGVVYHANYLRYFERGRTEWLRHLGFSQQDINATAGVVFTVANIEVDFVRPARLDDDLVITVVVEHMRRASLTFGQALTRKADGELLARARVRVGCVDTANFRPCALPEAFVAHVESLSSGVPA